MDYEMNYESLILDRTKPQNQTLKIKIENSSKNLDIENKRE